MQPVRAEVITFNIFVRQPWHSNYQGFEHLWNPASTCFIGILVLTLQGLMNGKHPGLMDSWLRGVLRKIH